MLDSEIEFQFLIVYFLVFIVQLGFMNLNIFENKTKFGAILFLVFSCMSCSCISPFQWCSKLCFLNLCVAFLLHVYVESNLL